MWNLNAVMLELAKGILTVSGAALYVFLMAAALPRLCLRLRAAGQGTGDLGIRRYVCGRDRGVVYEPAPEARRYLPQYTLFCRNGSKYLKCLLNPKVARVRYDVLAFDRDGRFLDLLKVSERVGRPGLTRAVALPAETAYARVVLRRADDMYRCRETAAACSPLGMGLYAAAGAALTVSAAWLFRACAARLLRAVLPDEAAASPARWTWQALLVGLLASALIVWIDGIRRTRRINQ